MQNLLDDLKKLLIADERLVVEGKLMKNKIIELGLALDKSLLSLLLSNATIKKHFFEEVSGILVFDKIKFMKFVSNKEFLPDSYTSFKNKIGLTVEDEFISEGKEVVLSFPYKDCYLEGGQTKEDASREEVFWNETLAPDEIDHLLSPKVISNFIQVSKSGEQKAKSISVSDNLIIKGNNLLALHSLKKKYSGKVKLIYIDPPYNTENDSFRYNDSFNHSSWLTFMKNRLEVAKELLSKEGAIFIQIDDKEVAYLRVLCDEIFGRENFKESIAVKNGSESGVNAINVMRGEQLFKVKEHILYYAKNAAQHRFKPFYVKAISFNESYRLEVIKTGNKYSVTDIYKKILKDNFKQETLRGLSEEQKQLFSVKFEGYCLNHSENMYALKSDIQKSGDTFKEFAKKNAEKGIVEEYKTTDGRTTLVYKGGMLASLNDRIVKENGKKFYGTLVSDFWWDIGATPSSEGSVELKAGKKPERLLKRILMLCTEPGDIVMDFFLGSGSTCAVAMKMQRKFIGIEQLDYGDNDSIVRLQNVIKGDSTGISKDEDVNWQGGGSFIKCELHQLNQSYIKEIKNAKGEKELNQLFKTIQKHGFISYQHYSALSEDTLIEFQKLSIEDKKKFLREILDNNFLYLNYSEIDDSDFNIPSEIKTLNNQFYK